METSTIVLRINIADSSQYKRDYDADWLADHIRNFPFVESVVFVEEHVEERKLVK